MIARLEVTRGSLTEYHLSDWGEGSAECMRAALRAAGGVR